MNINNNLVAKLTPYPYIIVGLLIAKQALPDSFAKTFGGIGRDVARSVQQTSNGGYIVAGYTTSFSAGGYDCLILKLDSTGTQEWAKTFGGIGDDNSLSVQQTSDGGYIVVGWTTSFGAGGYDYLVLKLDSAGTQEWAKTFGGTGWDDAWSVQQTSDTGYIIAGWAESFGAGDTNFLVLKLNSVGTQEWAKTFGEIHQDVASSVQQTSDGGYIIGGLTNSFGAGGYDCLALKLNSTGTQEWAKTFGGIGYDDILSIQQTSDGGYIAAGHTSSFGAVGCDCLVLKLGSAGTQEWAKTFGGTGYDYIFSVQQTSDSGYIFAGLTESFGAGGYDCLALKLNSTGTQEWAKTFGGIGFEEAWSVQQTSDSGYVVAGWTGSFGVGDYDCLVLKIDSDGSMSLDCPWTAQSVSEALQSLGADCTPTVNSYSMGTDCTPAVNSPTLSTSDVCTPVAEELIDSCAQHIYLEIIPSVSKNRFCIKYEIPSTITCHSELVSESKTLSVSLKLYDVCGSEKLVLVDHETGCGSYTRNLNLSDFTTGIYFLKLEAGKFKVIGKLTRLK